MRNETNQAEEFERTLGFAKTAVSHMNSNEIPCYPRNYELWFTYAAGFNGKLNTEINEILREKGHISIEEVTKIYEAFISPMRLGDRMDEVGDRMTGEVEDILSMVNSALGSTSAYSASLQGASTELTEAHGDTDAIKAIVAGLITTTKDFETSNRSLESQLSEAREQIKDLQTSLETVRYETLSDPLTGLFNRKRFDQGIDTELTNALERDLPLALVLCDIDHFKRFNDTYGHQTGDQVLRLVGTTLRQNVKGRDIACRYGGEEFAVILPETNLEQAMTVAEHIRTAVKGKELVKRSTGESLGRITISIGVACLNRNDNISTLIDRADCCLYAAKHRGRNRVVSEEDLQEGPSKAAVA